MMLESFMGPDKFQEGIHNFLKKYEFSNAATSDLWTELEVVLTLRFLITRYIRFVSSI